MEIEDQNIQIITEVVVKLNKLHIAIEKLSGQPTETEQNCKNIWPDSWIKLRT